MISILDLVLRKCIKGEVTSHLRPAMDTCWESVPSAGHSRGRRLEVGMGLSCLRKSKASVAYDMNEAGHGEIRETSRARSCRAS